MSITFGTEAEFRPGGSAISISVAVLGADKFVVAFRDLSDSGHGKAKVGTVSGSTIAFGAETVFHSASAIYFLSAAALSATQFVVAYRDADYNCRAKIGTVSGTDITFGTASLLTSLGTTAISVAALSSSKFVVAYEGTSNNGTANVGTVSGTAIVFGAATEFQTGGTNGFFAAALSDSQFVVAYSDAGDSSHGTAKMGTISGTSITFGAETEFLAANGAYVISAAALSSTKFVVVYNDGTDSYHGTAKVGTVSGTSITFGAEAEFLAVNGVTYVSIAALGDSKFIVTYTDGSDADHGTAKVGTVSGTSITFGAEAEFLAANGATWVFVAALSSTNFVVAYQDNSDSGHGTAKIGSLPTAWTVEPSDSISLSDSKSAMAGSSRSDSVSLSDVATPVLTHTYIVDVASDPSGATVSASPNDENGNGNGTTPFSRRYADGAGVTLTAPAKSGNRVFLEWRDGGGNTLSSSRALGVTVAGAGTYTAHYEFVGDSADDYLVASP